MKLTFASLAPLTRTTLYVILFSCANIVLYVLAVLGYTVFYNTYVPYPQVTQPLNFAGFNTTPVSQLLSIPNHKFRVLVTLDLPRDSHNKALGNFLVGVNPDPNGDQIRWRQSILPYKSELLEVIDTLTFLPLYLLGFSKQSTKVRLDFGVYDPAIDTMKALMVYLNKPVNLESAQIDMQTEWEGMRYWMYKWRLVMWIVIPVLMWWIESLVMTGVAISVAWLFNSWTQKSPVPKIKQETSYDWNTPGIKSEPEPNSEPWLGVEIKKEKDVGDGVKMSRKNWNDSKIKEEDADTVVPESNSHSGSSSASYTPDVDSNLQYSTAIDNSRSSQTKRPDIIYQNVNTSNVKVETSESDGENKPIND